MTKHNVRIFMIAIVSIVTAIANAASPWINDTGKIVEVYTSASGSIALRLDNGFPNAVSDGQCPSYNGWAGVHTADAAFKAAILSAKATNSPVTVTIAGCESGGHWMKIASIYVR